jgi:hypothetical protein
MRPWFGRIWVQQEIFASRNLMFRCGNFRFRWTTLLSCPHLHLKLPHLQPYILTPDDKSGPQQVIDTLEQLVAQIDAISELDTLHKARLSNFETYSVACRTKPDFVETLLDTSSLDATDPCDFICGIPGSIGFPARAASVHKWGTDRGDEIFIPIDYDTEIFTVLSTVTCVLLMKGGLAMIAKFQFFPEGNDSNKAQLPSWVID